MCKTCSETNVTEMNPIAIRERIIILQIGKVDRIYLSGQSLKVYCASENQTHKLLGTKQLVDMH